MVFSLDIAVLKPLDNHLEPLCSDTKVTGSAKRYPVAFIIQ